MSHQELLIRMGLSLLVGMIVGLERSIHRKTAGVRTYSLVCVGSTLFMLVSIGGFGSGDPGRVAAQIVTGIGFLGAGVIMKHQGQVMGLTTAAELWVTAGLGMAIGVGFYFLALLGITCVFLSLYASPLMARLGIIPRKEGRLSDEESAGKDTTGDSGR